MKILNRFQSQDSRTTIIVLWVVFLLGLIFHSQLALIPLFYGQGVAMPGSHGVAPLSHLWLMLGFYLIPMLLIITTVLEDSLLYRNIHFIVTIGYSILNFLHIAFDLAVSPVEWYQILLMVVVFGNGLLLNIVALDWKKNKP